VMVELLPHHQAAAHSSARPRSGQPVKKGRSRSLRALPARLLDIDQKLIRFTR
jgi:hypothetical protein